LQTQIDPSMVDGPVVSPTCRYSRIAVLPYTTLFRSRRFAEELKRFEEHGIPCFNPDFGDKLDVYRTLHGTEALAPHLPETLPLTDRKSTRLNSSHVKSSYAVSCLK